MLAPTFKRNLLLIAESMNSQKLDVAPYKKMGYLVRYDSDEYHKRRDKRVIMLGEIEVDDEKFVFFMA